MASYRESSGSRGNYRPLPAQARSDGNGRRHYDKYSEHSHGNQYRRNSPSPQRYTPPHERSKNSPHSMASGSRDETTGHEWDTRRDRDNIRARSDDRRGRIQSPRPGPRGGFRDRDREGYKSPVYDDRSRSQSPRRDRSPFFGGPPSREVMMDGLPTGMVEEDISEELKQYHKVEDLDDVRVIRDRQTKVSRGFGFLRFPTVEKSRAFLERNYPMIYLYGKNAADGDEQAAKVRIAFSRERDDRNRTEKADGEWTCKICTFVNFPGRVRCFKCQSPQIDMATFGNAAPAKPSEFLNSGDSDVSPDGVPSQFLLLRGLEPTVTEDLLAKGVAKLYKPGEREIPSTVTASKKGNAKVASTTGDANLGAKEGSIRRVLLVRDRRSNESWRYGFAEFASVEDAQAALLRFNSFEKFTISSKLVTASYIHAGVFVPVFNTVEANERFTFSPLGNTATKLAYWDEDAYVCELLISIPIDEKTVKTGEARAKRALDKAAAAAEKEGLVEPVKESEAKAKKRKAEAAASAKQKKTAPAHLQFWSNRHAELHGIPPEGSNEEDAESSTPDSKTPGNLSSTESANPPTQSFADVIKNCCYLCSRQFKTSPEVHKHERLSQLHRDNLKNEDLVSKAREKMTKAGLSLNPDEDTPEYRDRAKERRAAFGASKKISLPMKKSPSSGLLPPSLSTEADDLLPPAPSKGASLLGKMGWAAGEGLGARGKGMTAPIATEMYVQGVGLGAQGGKIGDAAEEAERNTKGGYGDFLERTREGAKERFERLG